MRSLLLLIFLLLNACSESNISRVDFLEGTWKVEGAEQYEAWEFAGNNELAGYSYRLENDQKNVSETLAITSIDGNLVYEATVPDQNAGMTISFELNGQISDYLSFENLEHDFPKKIQYKYMSPDSLQVSVLGYQDEGFTYKMVKQN